MKPSFVRVLAELALLYAEEGDLSRCLSKQSCTISSFISSGCKFLNISLFLRAEETFKHCLEKLPELKEKRVCLIIHQYYGDFHHYHTKNEAQAIAHYKEVSF